MISVMIILLSFLILVICALSLLFQLAWVQAYWFSWSFQRIIFWFHWFSLLICSFIFIYFSNSYYIFTSTYFGLNLLFFFLFLKWKLWLLILQVSSFLIYAFNSIYFCLSTVFHWSGLELGIPLCQVIIRLWSSRDEAMLN